MVIIIFDGECGFCNRAIMFIARNDINDCFKFVSNCSKFGMSSLEKFNLQGLEKSTIILIEEDVFYIKSTAIRKILMRIPYFKIFGYLMNLIPLKVSDWLYDFISNRRKRIVKNNDCEIPTPEMRKKFIL